MVLVTGTAVEGKVLHLSKGVGDAQCRMAAHSIQGQSGLCKELQLLQLSLRRQTMGCMQVQIPQANTLCWQAPGLPVLCRRCNRQRGKR